MDELGDTRYVFKFRDLSYLHTKIISLYFDVIGVGYIRCAYEGCGCSYQNAKNGILNGFVLYKYDIFQNSKDVASVP